jgi:hypothetical protein
MTTIGSEISPPVLQNVDARRARVRVNTQRMRARRKKGIGCRTIRVTQSELDRFQAAGYLDRAGRGDPAAEARAIECFITVRLQLAGRLDRSPAC